MSGIVGVVSQEDCKDDLFYPADYHSHLGTSYGGLAFSNGERLVRRVHGISKSQFKSKFWQDPDFPSFHGNKGIGVISDRDYQPLVAKLRFGEYAIACVGYINNQDELAEQLISNGDSFSEVKDGIINQTELVSKLINKKEDIVDGINYMNDQIEGSMSVLLLGHEGIYAARSKYGHSPLAFGKKSVEGKVSRIVSLESSAIKNMGFEFERDLGPNEILFLDEDREEQLQAPGKESQFCIFYPIYTGFPASMYDGISCTKFRLKSGEILAERQNAKLDGVWGVQGSGVIYSFGFRNNSDVPITPVTYKYTSGWDRSYTPPIQDARDFIAAMKQVAIDEPFEEVPEEYLINGKELGITEDSIVRGTQLMRQYLRKLWTAQAKGIHIMPGCPPLQFPCKFLYATRTKDELFARQILTDMHGRSISDSEIIPYLNPDTSEYAEMIRAMENKMKTVSLDSAGVKDHSSRNFSLMYQRLDDMIEISGRPKEEICTYCWDGCDPTKCTGKKDSCK
jgi:amidophosphoribosyltransferase